jgi:hypothetical protein
MQLGRGIFRVQAQRPRGACIASKSNARHSLNRCFIELCGVIRHCVAARQYGGVSGMCSHELERCKIG